jgi:hypothetical protein
MDLKVAKAINMVVVVLMSLEILGTLFAVLPPTSDARLAIHSKKAQSSILASFLFEKTEEENENTEEENDCVFRVILVDFSSVARSLSAFHSSDFDLSAHTFQFEIRPPVHQLNCVFLL